MTPAGSTSESLLTLNDRRAERHLMRARLTRRQSWLLFAILALALALRLATVRFGLPALNDPDEMMFELGALHMLRGPTLDPGWFGHPATTTMYVLALVNLATFVVGHAAGWFASAPEFGALVYADPSWMILPGRVAMVLFAVGTVWLTGRLATRLFGVSVGLMAALLLAFNPVHITWSQVIRSDIMACFFMLLCLQAACGIAERGRWRDYGLAAIWLGISVATKWPFALASIAMAAAALAAIQSGVSPRRDAAIQLVCAGLAAVGTLIVVSPYLLIDYPIVLRNLQGEGQDRHLGATGGDVWHNLWWYLSGPLYAGFGVVGFALLIVGAVQLRRNRLACAILAPVAIGFMLLLCCQRLVWERWALPLMPIGAIVAALGFVHVVALVRGRQTVRMATACLLLVAMLGPLVARIVSDGRARMTDTRQLASTWARQHIPRGSTVLIEHFAFDLVPQPWHVLFPLGNAGCIDALGLIRGKIGYATIDQARGGRSNLDYGTVVADKRSTCRADYAILTQADRYRQEREHFPGEYAAYRKLIATGRVTATFYPRPGHVAGPVTTVVSFRPHPQQ
jgi:hypothetical protein